MRLVVLPLLLAACGDDGSAPVSGPVKLMPYSPTMNVTTKTGGNPDATKILASYGDLVIVGTQLSRDGGTTWLDISLPGDTLKSATALSATQLVVSTQQHPIGTWDLATNQVTSLPNVPQGFSFACATSAGTLIGFSGAANKLARFAGGQWTEQVPPGAPTGFISFACSGTHALGVVSAGYIASNDDGQTWVAHPFTTPDSNLRELAGLPDGRFIFFGTANQPARIIDATGTQVAVTPPFPGEHGTRYVCPDGIAQPDSGKYTPDLGATWLPIVPQHGPDPFTLGKTYACAGGGYYYDLESVHFQAFVHAASIAGEPVSIQQRPAGDTIIDSRPLTLGPALTSDGAIFAMGLRWKAGDADWSFHEAVGGIAALGTDVYAGQGASFGVSHDSGATWTKITSEGGSGGISQVTGDALYYAFSFQRPMIEPPVIEHHLLKSSDMAAHWAEIYFDLDRGILAVDPVDDTIMREVGEISVDDAATWQPTSLAADRQPVVAVSPTGSVIAFGQDAMGVNHFYAYRDAGRGELLGTYELATPTGAALDADFIRGLSIDAAGYVYILTGRPLLQVFRTEHPLAP